MKAPGNTTYTLTEAVARFPTEGAFQQAVDELQENGFDRADLSVPSDRLPHYRNPDENHVARAAPVNMESIRMGKVALLGIPSYLGVTFGLIAGFAFRDAEPIILALAVLGGAVGGILGGLAAWKLGARHARSVDAQLHEGGMLLWVRTKTEAAQAKALEILTRSGGRSAHVHETTAQWGVDNVPLAHVNPDPFLPSARM